MLQWMCLSASLHVLMRVYVSECVGACCTHRVSCFRAIGWSVALITHTAKSSCCGICGLGRSCGMVRLLGECSMSG